MTTRQVIYRVIAGLVLLGAIAGIAFFAFNAGVVRGTGLELPAVIQPNNGIVYMHPHGGFGCLIPLFVLFLVFIAFGGMRRLIWGPRYGWGRHHCHPKHWSWNEGVPPMFDEWHRRAHAAPGKDADDTEKDSAV